MKITPDLNEKYRPRNCRTRSTDISCNKYEILIRKASSSCSVIRNYYNDQEQFVKFIGNFSLVCSNWSYNLLLVLKPIKHHQTWPPRVAQFQKASTWQITNPGNFDIFFFLLSPSERKFSKLLIRGH